MSQLQILEQRLREMADEENAKAIDESMDLMDRSAAVGSRFAYRVSAEYISHLLRTGEVPKVEGKP